MRSIKEALKRCYPWSACYFTSRKACWYPPTQNDISFRDISPILPSKAVPSSITVADEGTLWTWANTYTRTVVRQKQQWPRQGQFFITFTAKISDVAEITEEYSIPLIGADRCINCCSERERGSNRRSARR